MHIREKPSHEVKKLPRLCRGTDLRKAIKQVCCTEGFQEHSGLHNSSMEEVWNDQDSS